MATTSVIRRATVIGFLALGLIQTQRAAAESVGPVIWMPSMNTFRRFDSDPQKLFTFYADVLGFERLQTFDVGNNAQVARIKAGATELKFTRRTDNRSYVDGGVREATGLRLWTFFFSDEAALVDRFREHGFQPPEFRDWSAGYRSALVEDPDGQTVELVITGDRPGTRYDEIEIGLTVSDMAASRAFYRDFVGLEELPATRDPVFDTMKYSFRNGATTVSLRSFGGGLPADTGSGGIQYVVSNVERVDELAHEQEITIEQPLSGLPGFALRTIWLDDPDGITNYFAETAQARSAAQ